MKFKFGNTYAEQEAYTEWRENWHRKFAWLPVVVDAATSDYRWLEWVERKQWRARIGYNNVYRSIK